MGGFIVSPKGVIAVVTTRLGLSLNKPGKTEIGSLRKSRVRTKDGLIGTPTGWVKAAQGFVCEASCQIEVNIYRKNDSIWVPLKNLTFLRRQGEIQTISPKINIQTEEDPTPPNISHHVLEAPQTGVSE